MKLNITYLKQNLTSRSRHLVKGLAFYSLMRNERSSIRMGMPSHQTPHIFTGVQLWDVGKLIVSLGVFEQNSCNMVGWECMYCGIVIL